MKVFITFLSFLFVCNLWGQKIRLGIPVGHTDLIMDAEFSPDGKYVATFSFDHTIKIWGTEDGKLYRTFKGHQEIVEVVRFSPDGKFLLSASWDGTINIWNFEKGALLRTLNCHNDAIYSMEFSPDGKKICTSSLEGNAKTWDVESGKLLQTFEGHTDYVYISCFSPDNNYLLTGSADRTVKIWDVNSGKQLSSYQQKNSVKSAGFSPDGKYVLSTSWDSTVCVWDFTSGTLLNEAVNNTVDITSSSFNKIGKTFILGSVDKSAKVYETGGTKLIYTLKGHTETIQNADFSKDGQLILTCSNDSTIKIWNSTNGELLRTLPNQQTKVSDAKFSEDGKYIVAVYGNHTTIVWNVSNGKIVQILGGQVFTERPSRFSPDGKYVATLSHNSAVTIWNVEEGMVLHVLAGHAAFVYESRFTLDGKTLITVSADKTAKSWDVKTGKLLQTFTGHTEGVTDAILSPDSLHLSTMSVDGTCKVWELNTGKLIFSLSGFGMFDFPPEYSPDGQFLISEYEDTLVRIFETKTGNLLKSFKNKVKYSVVSKFSPDGKSVLITNSTKRNSIFGQISGGIYNSKTGKSICKLEGSLTGYYSFRFNKDGKFILGTSLNKAKIWDVTTGKLLPFIDSLEIYSVYFSQDGKSLIATKKGEVQVWELDTKSMIHCLKLPGDSLINCVFSVSGNEIITSSADSVISIWDLKKGIHLRNLEGKNAPINLTSLSNDGKYIVIPNEIGSYAFFNFQTGKMLFQQYVFNQKEILTISPDGYFDATPNAMEQLYWIRGMEIIDFSQLKDRYWIPGLWKKIMNGEELPEPRGLNELKLQPEVVFGEEKDGKIPVTLTKRDGGYGKVSILINGKEVQADARGELFDNSMETQTIWVDLKDHPNLQNGENIIAVKASSEDGFVTGRTTEKKVTMSLQTSKPHFYAVVIGTGKYVNSSINLKYPEKDAASISTALSLGAEQLFGADKTHIYTLTTAGTDRPTKEKIKSVLSEIGEKATSKDVILVYLSGHGIAWGGEQGDFYYVTTDAISANAQAYNDEAIRKNNTISTTEFTEYLNAIPANKQVMIIDACSSGKAVDNLLASKDIEGSKIKAIDRMKDRTGMFVISGSAADAVSYEASKYGQGLLTYSILQAMKGASLREGQFFDVDMLLNYARENVPKLAAGIGGIQTPQLLVPKGGSFDIGQVTEDSKKQIPLNNIKPIFVRSILLNIDEMDDVLDLGKDIDEAINQIASRGADGQLVFIDTRDFPDAYRLSGGYTQKNGTIELKLKVKGIKENEYLLSAPNKEELIAKVIEIVEGIK